MDDAAWKPHMGIDFGILADIMTLKRYRKSGTVQGIQWLPYFWLRLEQRRMKLLRIPSPLPRYVAPPALAMAPAAVGILADESQQSVEGV